MTFGIKKALRWVQYAMLLAGFAALGYCTLVFIEARHYQAWAEDRMKAQMEDRLKDQLKDQTKAQMNKASSLPVASQAGQLVQSVSHPETVSTGGDRPIAGRIDIPAAHISAMIAEGASAGVLRVAVGHVPGTAMPGHPGNVGLAAHRDTFFRGLGELKPGDVIRVTVPGKEYVYRVRFTDIVSPNETWVLGPTSYESLTLITCYPFHYIGAAPKRFIVRAGRSENE